MNAIIKRGALLLFTGVIACTNALIPAGQAFADQRADKPVYCNIQGNSGKMIAQMTPGNTEHEYILHNSDGTITYVSNQSEVTPAMQAACLAEYGQAIPTLATAPQTIVCGANNDSIAVVTNDAWTQAISSWSANTATVTYTLAAGFVWSDNTNTPISIQYTDAATACPPVITVVTTPTPQVPVDDCNPLNITDNVTWKDALPASTSQILWSESTDGKTRTAHLMDPQTMTWTDGTTADLVFTLPADNGVACEVTPPPTITPCTEMNSTIVVTRDSQFADFQDTRAHGFYGFALDGLKIWTTDNTSLAKVAWYHAVDYPLASIGTPSMNYTSTLGVAPGMQIVLDADGDGAPDGILVGEPGSYGANWWSNTDFGVGAGMGYASYGTLNDYLAANPDAQVMAVGFSLGSGVYASGVLRSITFGCQTWTFTMQSDPGTGGGTPTTPVDPPAVPSVSTPSLTTNGQLPTPAELPHTGMNQTGLISVLIAGLATYAAVYFAQNKRRFEQ